MFVIGDTAGKVWKTLGKEGKLTITDLARKLNVDNNLVNQAVGWLARENKINLENKGKAAYISLTPKEQTIYQHQARV
jgi:Mn-dependent DtxR family transcriptional regulator